MTGVRPAVVLATVAVAGCGDGAGSRLADVAPASCERTLVTFHDGSRPTRRMMIVPPPPRLRAVATTQRTTRIEWSFRELPDACRPAAVKVTVRATTDRLATPTAKEIRVRGLSGSTEITYPEFLPVPDVANASAYSREGRRSRVVEVSIERRAGLPPEPPKPPRPVTAPASDPITCAGRPTVVEDPVGDVLGHEPGSPPAPVGHLSPELSAIDVVRAAVQLDGRTMCGTFELGRAPADGDFELRVTLRDATTSTCCASLLFRRTAGRLEVGHEFWSPAGSRELRPVSGAGASLRGTTLLVTGTFPPPSAWQLRTKRMPTAENVGWSVTTGYSPKAYCPCYGDWLPAYDAVNEPIVRHRDGAIVRPGATQ